MNLIEIENITHPGVEIFSSLTERQLRNQLDPTRGLFIAESPKVIKVALDAGMAPVAMLCEKRHIDGDAHELLERIGDIPVYTGSREVLASLTGYVLTRGVLCALRRPRLPSLESICAKASRVAVIDGVSDTTNIGAIFRSAAAMGIDSVVLTPDSCDPLNRRAVRVSMGSVFLVPWTIDDDPVASLKRLGFTTVALALADDSVSIDDPILKAQSRMAMILGTEGDGLSYEVISKADFTARIPMHHGVDSLNVAAASAVAFWELRL